MKCKAVKISCLLLAFLCLGIGMIGVVLPILPTTPFLMIASFLFAKGSDRFHKWFISTKLYKNHLEEFIITRAMTLKKKISVLLPVSAMLISAFILANNLHARISIVFVMMFKYYYFFTHIKTIKEDGIKKERKVILNGEYSRERNI